MICKQNLYGCIPVAPNPVSQGLYAILAQEFIPLAEGFYCIICKQNLAIYVVDCDISWSYILWTSSAKYMPTEHTKAIFPLPYLMTICQELDELVTSFTLVHSFRSSQYEIQSQMSKRLEFEINIILFFMCCSIGIKQA